MAMWVICSAASQNDRSSNAPVWVGESTDLVLHLDPVMWERRPPPSPWEYPDLRNAGQELPWLLLVRDLAWNHMEGNLESVLWDKTAVPGDKCGCSRVPDLTKASPYKHQGNTDLCVNRTTKLYPNRSPVS